MYHPQGMNYSIYVLGIIFLILSSLAVIGRFVTRKMNRTYLGADDWLLIPALAGLYAYIGLVLWGIAADKGGKSITDPTFNYNDLKAYLKSQYFSVPAFTWASTFPKFSLLCLYRRIFTVRKFQQVSLGVGIFTFLYAFSGFIAGWLYCIPVKKFWNPTVSGHCFNFSRFFLSTVIIEIIIDLVILSLPLRMISTLQLSLQKKLMLSGIFLLGIFVPILNIVRIIEEYVPDSQYLSLTTSEIVNEIMLGVQIMCACLPTYRPLISKVAGFPSTLRKGYSSMLGSRQKSASYSRKTQSFNSVSTTPSRYNRMGSDSDGRAWITEATATSKDENENADNSISLHQIEVRRDFEVV